jgi:hypothetical protein
MIAIPTEVFWLVFECVYFVCTKVCVVWVVVVVSLGYFYGKCLTFFFTVLRWDPTLSDVYEKVFRVNDERFNCDNVRVVVFMLDDYARSVIRQAWFVCAANEGYTRQPYPCSHGFKL